MVKMIESTTFHLKILAGLVLVVGLGTGCTKKTESSTLNIAMPNWSAVAEKYSASKQGKAGALSGTKVTAVTRVMINITGPGMPTSVRIWDLNDIPRSAANTTLPQPPAEFSFEIPRGSDRLFQALAILEEIDLSSSESGGGPVTFLYGDVTKSITQAVEAVPITLVNQGTASGSEGTLSGRYLSSAGVGPSGKVNMYYAPSNGRPEMVVQTTAIFSGFLHFFVPPAGQFSYRMADSNTALFEKITINSFDAALATKLLKIEVPAAFRVRDMNTAVREPSAAKTKLIGFFGPGASTETVCYNNYGSTLNSVFMSADPGNPTVLQWNPNSGLTTDARRVGGGLSSYTDSCPGGYGDFGVGHLYPRIQSLPHGDSPLGLRGPFQELAANSNNFLSHSASGTQLSLFWKYLRPTIGDSVDGVGVFTKVLAANENSDLRWHDSAPCSSLTSLGFTEITRVAAGTQASPVETYTITGINTAAYSSGRHVTAICPYSNTKGYYDFALTHSSGSTSGQIIATRLQIQRLGEPGISAPGMQSTKVIADTCTPMVIRSVDNYGNLARKSSGSPNAYITHFDGLASMFSMEPNCTSPSSTLSFDMHQTEHIFYLRLDPMTGYFSVMASDFAGTPLEQTTFYGIQTAPAAATNVFASTPSTVYQHQCFPFSTTKFYFDGTDKIPQGDMSGQTIDYSTTLAQVGLSFFTDGNCDTAAGSLFYSSETGVASKKYYAMYSGAQPSITFAPQVSGLTSNTTSLPILTPGPAVRARLQIGNQANPSTCIAVRLSSVDSQGRASAVTANTVTEFNFSSTPVGASGMFSDAICSMPTSTVTISSGQIKSGIFYFRWVTNESLTITSAAGSSLPLIPATVSVSP